MKSLIGGILSFLLALACITFLFQGLPASDMDDRDKIVMSREIPWGHFITAFLTPWSQSQNWVGQTDRDDEVRYKRMVLPILLKLSHQWFGHTSFSMFFLTKGIPFAGCVTLVFLMLSSVVPFLYAILGTLVFMFVPAHYSHVLWIADSATICYLFLFLGVFIFYFLQKNILESGSDRQFSVLLFALFIAGWTGIRAKEPMLVLPIMVFLRTLFLCRHWRSAPWKFIVLNIAMAFVAFQIIPVTHLTAGGSFSGIHFNFETIGRLLFRNYECGYDNELVSAFFSWDHVFPVSVSRTFGFFILWSMIISSGVLAWRKWVQRQARAVCFWNHPLIQICGIWLLVELPFLGMFQPDPRYFSGTLAPILILCARLIYCAVRDKSRFIRWGLLVFALLGLGFNLYENVQNSLSVRIMIGRKLNYFSEVPRMIFKDIRGRPPVNELELGRFYCSLSAYADLPGSIKNSLYYILGMGFEGWNKVPVGRDSLDDFESQTSNGYVYYVTPTEFDLSGKPHIKKIGSVDGINKHSILERGLFKKKKKRPTILNVYKCSKSDAMMLSPQAS